MRLASSNPLRAPTPTPLCWRNRGMMLREPVLACDNFLLELPRFRFLFFFTICWFWNCWFGFSGIGIRSPHKKLMPGNDRRLDIPAKCCFFSSFQGLLQEGGKVWGRVGKARQFTSRHEKSLISNPRGCRNKSLARINGGEKVVEGTVRSYESFRRLVFGCTPRCRFAYQSL